MGVNGIEGPGEAECAQCPARFFGRHKRGTGSSPSELLDLNCFPEMVHLKEDLESSSQVFEYWRAIMCKRDC